MRRLVLRARYISKQRFQKIIYGYFKKNARNFPWRRTHDPYRILVSEMMLQQTQVSRVEPKYRKFISTFPDFSALARASLSRVLRLWQGLGYNRRALALKAIAKSVVRDYRGRLPDDLGKLMSLPGIGQATASAIMAFVFNKPFPFLETNIRTVYIHFFFKGRKNVSDSALLKRLTETLDVKNPRQWYYALMDYGAMLKATRGNLSRQSKGYHSQSPFIGSRRELRGQILRLSLRKPHWQFKKILDKLLLERKWERPEIEKTYHSLVREGFFKKS